VGSGVLGNFIFIFISLLQIKTCFVIAIAGGGIAGAGALTKEEKETKKRKLLIWTGISIVLTILIWYIWVRMSGGCKTCTIKLP
jgi:hypothetical protein